MVKINFGKVETLHAKTQNHVSFTMNLMMKFAAMLLNLPIRILIRMYSKSLKYPVIATYTVAKHIQKRL